MEKEKNNIKILEQIEEFNCYVKNLNYLIIPQGLFKKDMDGIKLKIIALLNMYETSIFYLSDKDFSEMFNIDIEKIKKTLTELEKENLISIDFIELGITKIRYIKKTIKFYEYLGGYYE